MLQMACRVFQMTVVGYRGYIYRQTRAPLNGNRSACSQWASHVLTYGITYDELRLYVTAGKKYDI
jgi:hypothetical protein